MEAGIRRVLPQAQVVCVPVADGEEGQCRAFDDWADAGGPTVTGPEDGPLESFLCPCPTARR